MLNSSLQEPYKIYSIISFILKMEKLKSERLRNHQKSHNSKEVELGQEQRQFNSEPVF